MLVLNWKSSQEYCKKCVWYFFEEVFFERLLRMITYNAAQALSKRADLTFL